MNVNDLQYAFLKSQGYTGSLNDAYRAYLLNELNATTGSIDDLLYRYLHEKLGYSGSIDDMMYEYLQSLGYTGSLSDMLYAAWGEAGISGPISFEASLTTTVVPEYGNGPVTFTRNSTARVEDHEGIIRHCFPNEARFQGARRVRNFVLEDFSNASFWSKAAAGTGVAPVVTSGQIAPDGTATAYRLQLDRGIGVALNDQSYIQGNVVGAPASPGAKLRSTVWVKSNTGLPQTITIRAGSTYTENAVVTVSNNWQRFSIIDTSAGFGAIYMQISCRGAFTDQTADVLIWHPQCESVSSQTNENPSEYVSVGVATPPLYHGAGVDGVQYFDTLNPNTVTDNVVTVGQSTPIPSDTLKGYLAENIRYNLCLQSQILGGNTWTVNNTTVLSDFGLPAPDGTTTADKIQETAVTGTHFIQQTFVKATSAILYTYSIYVKSAERGFCYLFCDDNTDTNSALASWNLSTGANISSSANGDFSGVTARNATMLPNGWCRCSLTFTANTNNALRVIIAPSINGEDNFNYAGTLNSGILAWGAQLEAAPFPSSYIPTETGASVRAQDVLTYPATGNATGGPFTQYAETNLDASVLTGIPTNIISVDDGTDSNRTAIRATNLSVTLFVNAASVSQGQVSSIAPPTGARKIAASYGADGAAAIAMDGVVATGTFIGAYPTELTTLRIGDWYGGGTQPFGNIKNVRIYKEKLTDQKLAEITS